MLTITVYQASGEVATHVQKEAEVAARLLDRINPAKVFSESRILIGSSMGLSIYNGHRISRIDIVTNKTLSSLLPPPQPGPVATVMDEKVWEEEFRHPDAPADYGIPEGEVYTSGIQFGLLGNHRVSAKITSELVGSMERINRISSILKHPFLRLTLSPFGATLLNPDAIARVTLQPAFSTLPNDIWPATHIV